MIINYLEILKCSSKSEAHKMIVSNMKVSDAVDRNITEDWINL